MSYRYNISYPFFDVAQRYDVDYAHVLAFEDFLENYAGKAPWRPEHKAASAALSDDAKQELYALAKLPVHERGGRTDICDPCPFCRGAAAVGEDIAHGHFFVNCADCTASTNVLLPDHQNTREEAIALWNKRVSS